MSFYQQDEENILKDLTSSIDGLQNSEIKKRQEKDGFNELKTKTTDSALKLFLGTFKDAMVIVLLIVAVIQMALGDVMESLIIFAVLMVNSIVSVIQTKKAEGSLDALKQLSAPLAKVVRNGVKEVIPAREIVVGDIVLLDAGDYVPADGRLLESGSLRVDEGMLTGESVPVEKDTKTIEGEVPLGDRFNMVYSGSMVVYGRGLFVVTGTANDTEIGKVASLLDSASNKATPLQVKLDAFSKKLGVGILVLCVLIFAIQAARIYLGEPKDLTTEIIHAFMFAVAVAVAAIPEALQSIVTIVLSVGTNKMAKKHAIIRKLPAVETLGSTSVICTDKTGTLTQNKMTVVDYYLPNGQTGDFNTDPTSWSISENRLIQIAVLCNDSGISEEGQEIGDPTEVALIAYSNKLNLPYQNLRSKFPREDELPFDSDRKLMSTIHTIDNERVLLTKGGPDVVFNRCTSVLLDGEVVPLTDELLTRFSTQNEEFSNRALRVLAYAYKPFSKDNTLDAEAEHDLILVGITAMIDPPREAVYAAIDEANKAGIHTVMITGDHKTTAKAIGREIGLMAEDDIALTGQELDALSDNELDAKLEKISVYARVSPENKIRIVRAWQKKGNITAMTGDGVNDAPALKQADIGIAMGSGTDVAKDAAAMVLTDDNFVSIISAVEVGRNVFDNIKKAIAYLFAGNLGAIIAIIAALVMDWVNPFTALQLLFINLVNDSLPAIALGMEKAEPDVMDRKPRDVNEGIFAGDTLKSVLYRGILIGIAVIISQYIGLSYSNEMSIAMAFTTLILARTLQTFAARSNAQTAFGAGFFSNKYVLLAVGVCSVLYAFTVLPGVREIFSIPANFGWDQWLVAAGLAVGAVILMEITKIVTNKLK